MYKALSNIDIFDKIGKEIPVYPHYELEQFYNSDDLFGDSNEVLILYPGYKDGEVNEYDGHWTCLTRVGFGTHTTDEDENDTSITFFDSYGSFIDDFLFIEDPYLARILYNDALRGYSIEYNPIQLQKKGNTCGRWCIMWILNHDKFDVDTFSRNMSKLKGDLDSKIVELTV